MQGSLKVVQELNQLLTGELTASDQYFVQSQMYLDWGHHALYERCYHEHLEELVHAGEIVKRILLLGGKPNVASRSPLNVGTTVPEMLKNSLQAELGVSAALRKAIAICESEQDYETRRILTGLLQETEEDHIHWLEKQLHLIHVMGLENYLQSASKLTSSGESK